MVIDDTWVVTGSANFTTTAFGSSSSYSNYENIVIINSNEIAQEYHEEFNRIKDKTLHLYLNIIASSNPFSIEPWLKELAKKLYQENNYFKQLVYERWEKFQKYEKIRLQQFFRWRVPTPKQNNFLINHGKDVEGMSFDHASQLIDKIIKKK
jgi:phosphatidylserine/phosphatidylglycerophosphate/cardiolipin synthase-like enzyme